MKPEAAHPTDNLLASISYFAHLDESTRQTVASSALARDYSADQVIFLEGKPSAGLCVVATGWLKAIKQSLDGREQILDLLGPGDVFNAIGVFATEKNPATVIALEPARVWIFPRPLMRHLLESHPALAHAVIEDLAARVLHLITIVEDLSLRTVEARLARLLLEQTESGAASGTLPRQRWATQAEIAARLGTVPDVVNRALRNLSQAGYIRVERHQIQIIDRAALLSKTNPSF